MIHKDTANAFALLLVGSFLSGMTIGLAVSAMPFRLTVHMPWFTAGLGLTILALTIGLAYWELPPAQLVACQYQLSKSDTK